MKRMNADWFKGIVALSLALVMLAATAPHQEASSAGEAQAGSDDQYLRVTEEKGKWVALEIATRQFRRDDVAGPMIALVGVAHIGDKGFYRAVQKLLATYDIVLYESVLPAGAKGAGGKTKKQRIESTKSAMEFVGSIIETHHSAKGRYPDDLVELREFAGKRDARLGQWIANALQDAWDQPLHYHHDGEGGSYSLASLGRDHEEGGQDADADLVLSDFATPEPIGMGGDDDNIQAQLAAALGLKFQLEAIDYDHENWICSDMAMDQVDRALKERGVDFELVSGALAGTSMMARIAKVFLGLLRFADTFFDGAIADTFKVVLIEMLGDESAMEMSMVQFGEGFNEVIVEMRNQVVVDDLKQLIQDRPEAKSVAIFYGAAHMGDMAERLTDQLGYEPVETQWLRAIEVDIEQSAVSRRELLQIRLMMRQMMRAQRPPPDKPASQPESTDSSE